MVINFIEHISMAHPLCHALFTQLELGIKRYTYWAGGQKYFYRPDLLAGPCRMGSCACSGAADGFGMWHTANCIMGLGKIQVEMDGHCRSHSCGSKFMGYMERHINNLF